MTAKNLLHSITARSHRTPAGWPSFQHLAGLWLLALCLWLPGVSAKAAETVVANYGGHSLTIVNLVTGDRTLLVTTNAAGVNLLAGPVGVAREANGNLIIGEDGGNRLIRINPATGLQTILSSGSVGTGPAMSSIYGLAVEAGGHIIVGSSANQSILRVDPVTGDRTVLASSSVGSGVAMVRPFGVTIDTDGSILLPNWNGSEVVRLDPATGVRTHLSSSTNSGPSLSSPTAVLRLPDGDYAALNNSDNNYILRIDPATGDRTLLSGTTRGDGPTIALRYSMALADDGNLYVADFGNNRILRVDVATGDRTIVSAVGVGEGPAFSSPLGMLGGAVSSIIPTEGVMDLAGNELTGTPYTSGETYIYQTNYPPTAIQLSVTTVGQSGGANATVGTLSTTDADGSDTHTYTLVSGAGDTDNASFNISGSTLRANDASALAAGSYSVRIQTDDGNGGTYAEAFAVTVADDIAPVVTSVAVPTNGTYEAAQYLDFTVTFSEVVTVTGTPTLGLTIGATPRTAGYFSGSGTNTLVFRHQVLPGDEDTDGIEIGGLALAGGTIRDAAHNDVDLTLDNVPSTAGVRVDGVFPTILSINRLSPATATTMTNRFVFRVTFSEPVQDVTPHSFYLYNEDHNELGVVESVAMHSPSEWDVTGITTNQGTVRLQWHWVVFNYGEEFQVDGLHGDERLTFDGAGNFFLGSPSSGTVTRVVPGVSTNVVLGSEGDWIVTGPFASDAAGQLYAGIHDLAAVDWFNVAAVVRVVPGVSSNVVVSGLGSVDAMAVDAEGNLFYTHSDFYQAGSYFISKLTPEGHVSLVTTLTNQVQSMQVGPNGDLYLGMFLEVFTVAPDGSLRTVVSYANTGELNPQRLAVAPGGVLYVGPEFLLDRVIPGVVTNLVSAGYLSPSITPTGDLWAFRSLGEFGLVRLPMIRDLAGQPVATDTGHTFQTYTYVPNATPTDILLSNASVNQSGGENAAIGALTSTDADEADTHTYALVEGDGDSDNASFNIFENALRANDASALAAGEYSIRIRTTDNHEASFEKSFAITVVDDVAPVITSAATAGGTYGAAFAYTISATGGAVSFNATGLPAGLSVSAGTGEITGSPAQTGVFNVELSAADAAENADTQSLELTIAKAAAAIDLAGLEPTYDGTAKAVSATTTPDGLTVSFTYDGEIAPPTAAGSYTIVATVSDENFAGTANATLVIGKAALVATADDANRAYGASNPEFTGSFTSAVEGDNLSVSYSTTANEASDVGAYDIVPAINDPGEKLGNYAVTLNHGTLTVDKAVIVATADDQSRVYGANNPELTISYSGFVNDETVEALDELPVAATVATAASGVGEYDITLSGGVDGNYVFDRVAGTLTVTPAALVATADDANRAYGAGNPEFTGSFTGAVEGDSLGVSYTTTATATSAVGTYEIVPTITDPDEKLPNYSVTLNHGTLTVNKAVIVATANDQSRAYGAANPELTIAYTGFVNDETVEALDELPVAATEATATSAVGEYAITLSGGVDGNYTFDLVAGTLTITPAALVATADDASRAYGASNPEFTGSFTGAVEGDNLSVSYSTTATEASDVGTYNIVPAINDPDEKLGNYTVTLNNGTLTVNKAVIVATAADQSRAYGVANPEFTIAYTGFVNDETVEALDELPVAATEATAASAVGGHDITVSGGADANYEFTRVAGVLTITPAALLVTADDASRPFGQANPVFTGGLEGLVNDDAITAEYTTTATTESPAGTYDIVPVLNDPDERLANYTVTMNAGTLTVTGDDAPVISLGLAAAVYTLRDEPALLAPAATVTDGGSPHFGGGTLSVSVQFNDETLPQDQLHLLADESSEGLAWQDNTLLVNSVAVGTFTGGFDSGLPLQVTFTEQATPATAQALVRRLAFVTTNGVELATRTLSLQLTDGEGGVSDVVELPVAINRRPETGPDTIVTLVNAPVITLMERLLANDADPDSDEFSLHALPEVSEAGGTLALVDGELTYTPAADFAGVDSFDYVLVDARGGLAVGRVTLKVLVDKMMAIDLLSAIDPDLAGTGPNDAVVHLAGFPGRTFRVEAADDLAQPVWDDLGLATVDENGLLKFIDPSTYQRARRFFRLIEQAD